MSVMDSLADQLFAEMPARRQERAFDRETRAHRYVESRVFSGSRGIHPENNAPPQRLWETALANEIMHTERLGPYELQLLASVLRAPHSLVVITGSTGSGKSSTLRNVVKFYDENAKLNQARARLGLNPTHAYVDFNKLEKEFHKVEQATPGTGLDLLYEKIPMRIAQALLKSVRDISLQRKCPPLQVVLELARDAYRWVAGEEDVPEGRDFDWPDLLALGPPVLTGDPVKDFDVLQRRLAEQARDRKRSNIPLMFWCAVLDALAVKSLPTGKSTLLVLDNIDPLPDAAQLSLRDEFVGLCLEKNFKVILSLRHSRFRAYRPGSEPPPPRTKQAVFFNWYPHCGPNPVEVVCHRILGFIAEPDDYPAFNDLDPEWQAKALHRALELLLRLTRGAPHYRTLGQLAVAGAGDSVRRALQTIRFLFENSDFSFDYESAAAARAITQLSLELQAVSCSSAIGLALREELVGIAMECSERGTTNGTVNAWGARLAKLVKSIMHGTFDPIDLCFAPRVDALWAHPELQSMFTEDVETACALLHARLVHCGISAEQAHQLRATLGRCFLEKVELLCAAPPTARGFLAFVTAISAAMAGEKDARDGTEDEREFSFSWDRLRICANVLSTNRSHVMARALIRAGYLHNLFIDGGNNLSSLALTLVYYLALQEDGEAPLATILELLGLELDEEGTLSLVNRLCNEKGRVLWINQDFAHDSYAELEVLGKSGARVKLTHGGWAYYLGVLDEIDYLMETFCEQSGHARASDLLSVRLESALRGLENLLSARPPRGHERYAQWSGIQKGVVPDVIVRCTPGLIRAVRGHFSKMQDHRTPMSREVRFAERVRTRQIVGRWKTVLINSKDRACSGVFAEAHLSPAKNMHLVPLGRVGRVRGFGPAAGACQSRWLNAVNALQNLLAGSDLWEADFAPDEHRAEAGA